jgi:hypothetical protein
VTLLDRGKETLLTGNAVAERARHANKRAQMTFDAEIIVFALDLGVYNNGKKVILVEVWC